MGNKDKAKDKVGNKDTSKDKGTDRVLGPNEKTRLPSELAKFVAEFDGDTAKDNAQRSGVSEREARAAERQAASDAAKDKK